MVGVAGKYKGCNSCRLRRVKCDGQRPICKKCANSKRECGYERQATFIVGTIDDQGRCSSHPHRSQLLYKKKNPPPETSPASSGSQSSPTVERRTVSLADSSPKSDNSSQYRSYFLALHEQCLAQERQFGMENPNGDSFGTASLIQKIPALAFHSPTLDCSLLALLLLSMAEKNPDERALEANKWLFSEILSKLRNAFRDCRGGKTIGSTAASMCLFLCESGSSGSTTNWKILVEECTSLVKGLGAFSFRKFPEQQLFVGLFRPAILWQALGSCQTTFLSLPEWTAVPWEETSKTPMDTLTDNMIQLPMLLERGASLQSTPASIGRRFKILDYLQNCFRVDATFQTWHKDMETKTESFHYYIAETNSTNDPIFPAKFGFTSFQNSLLHINFWASLRLFYTMIFDTHALLSEPYFSNTSGMAYVRPSNNQPLPPKYLPGGITILASNVCQSLNYCLGDETVDLGSVSAVAPLYCAQSWFGGRMSGSGEDLWCKELMARLLEKGFPMIEQLSGCLKDAFR